MIHESCKEMLAIDALSALDTADQRELQSHLDTCTVCRRELAEWQAMAAALAYVAAPLEPSAQVRERILESVRTEDRAASSAAQPNVLNFASAAEPARSQWPAFAAIAASIISVALAIGLLLLWRQNRAAEVELARISRELRLQEQKLANENRMVQILTTPGARSSELAGTKDAPNAQPLLTVDRQSGRAVFFARGLPPAPAARPILWFISSGQPPAPGKVFTTDAGGNALMEDQLPANVTEPSVFAVTLEPQSGVSAPTGSMYLLSPSPGRR
jgi:anti-sigma-K factor RskA